MKGGKGAEEKQRIVDRKRLLWESGRKTETVGDHYWGGVVSFWG
jgi:hypothetical protein